MSRAPRGRAPGTATRAPPPDGTDKAAPHRPGVACPHPPLAPSLPPFPSEGSLRSPGGADKGALLGPGAPARSAPPANGTGGNGVAIWGHAGESGGWEGVPGGAARSGEGYGNSRLWAVAAAQNTSSRSATPQSGFMARAGGGARREAGGKSSGTRAQRERCVRGSGGGAV